MHCTSFNHHGRYFRAFPQRYKIKLFAIEEPDEKLAPPQTFPGPSTKSQTEQLRSRQPRMEYATTTAAEAVRMCELCRGTRLVVFNLFAIEGFSVAEAVGARCAAVTPFLLDRPPPSRFEAQLKQAVPELFHRLKKATTGSCSYAEVDHWMWRLFLDDVGEVREALDLPACPYHNKIGAVLLKLPAPPLLLVGVSSVLVPRAPYWPASVVLCGQWSLEAVVPPTPQYTPPAAVAALLASATTLMPHGQPAPRCPVFIGFGSMESLGFLDRGTMAKQIAHAILGALRTFGEDGGGDGNSRIGSSASIDYSSYPAIVQVSKGSRLHMAIKFAAHAEKMNPAMLAIVTDFVPHGWLFPQCSAIIHHGGAGTVHTALAAGTPQVICPFHFDNDGWAERLAALGLSPPAIPAKDLSASGLAEAMAWALTNESIAHAEQFAATIAAEECGAETAKKHLQRYNA
jgi:hypothetical protein